MLNKTHIEKTVDSQKKLGSFIRSLREKQDLTQAQFAKLLKTSQSAVARMEAGGQNLTTKELAKVGEALEKKVISLDASTDFKITGGKKLSGEVITQTSKNGAMGLMCAALINKGKTTLHGIPRIEEVYRLIEVLESIGVRIAWTATHTLEIRPPKKFSLTSLNVASAIKVRSSLMFIGALIHFEKRFILPHAGGCKMGARTIAAHKFGLEELGVVINVRSKDYEIKSEHLKSADIVMYEASDTATENLLIAAALIPGQTTIRFAPPNYQVQDVCRFLQKIGISIQGIGTTTLTVAGVEEISQDVEYHNSEDPTDAMMFLSAAVTTGSQLTIKRAPLDFLSVELQKLKIMGLRFKLSKSYLAHNGFARLVDITVLPSRLTALDDKIHAQPYPGINSDNLPFFVPIATQAKGTTLVHDWMWENRAIYFTELNRLSASVVLADPHRVFVTGRTKLKPAQVVCPPALRPATIVLIAMLAAEGVSVLRNVYSIERGYEEIAKRLNAVGAHIEIMRGI
jgi:UDP-N-acetylglucosamine 1-carboxyvinyltransferase